MAKRDSVKRLLRIMVVAALGAVLLPVLLAAWIGLTYTDDDYRDLITGVTAALTGARLSIDGHFSLVLDATPALSAGAISYRAANGAETATIDELDVQIALRPLLERRLVIQRLALKGARLDIRETPSADDAQARETDRFALPVVDNIRLEDVYLNYHKQGDAQPVTLRLDHLNVDDVKPGSPLKIAASGEFSHTAFNLTGESGDLQSLLQGTTPYPVSAQLDLGASSLRVDGRIGAPLAGRGLDLVLDGKIAALEKLLGLYHVLTPDLGRLTFQTRVTGELAAPSVQDLQASLRRDGVSVNLSGDILEPLRRRAVALTLEARIDDPQLLAWIARDPLPPLRELNLSGRLSGSGGRYRIEHLDTRLRGQRALILTLSGSAQLTIDKPALTDVAARVTFDAASSGVLRSLHSAIPLIGPLGLEARVQGSSRRLTITGLKAHAGSESGVQLVAEGQLSLDNLLEQVAAGPVNVMLHAQAASTADLSDLTGLSVPDLGPFTARARLDNGDGSLGLEDVTLNAGKPGALTLSAEGVVDNLAQADQIALNINVQAGSLAALGRPFSVELPDEGKVTLSGRFAGRSDLLALQGRIELARSSLDMNLHTDLSGARPKVTGKLSLPRLHVGDIGLHPAADSGQNKPQPAGAARPHEGFFSRAPIDLSALDSVDLDLTLRIEEVFGTRRLYDRATAGLQLENGVLHLQPLEISFAGGRVDAGASIDSRSRPPQFALRLSSDDLGIGELMEQKDGSETPLRGFLTSSIELHSQGSTQAELAANLGGHIDLISENARVSRRHLELLTKDVFGWTLSTLVRRQRMVNIDCGMVRLKIADGIVRTETLVVDWPGASTRADATVDLGRETLDAVIYPEQKRRLLWNTAKPIRVSGSFREPEIKATSVREISESAAKIALLAPVMISADLLGELKGLLYAPGEQIGACARYIEQP